jgi:DNA-binding transcriptional MerR regulator
LSLNSISGDEVTTAELLQEVNIPRQRLYYLEQKGFIRPTKKRIGEKDFRDYSQEDLDKVRAIWRYLQQGLRYSVAYERALEDLRQPSLLGTR